MLNIVRQKFQKSLPTGDFAPRNQEDIITPAAALYLDILEIYLLVMLKFNDEPEQFFQAALSPQLKVPRPAIGPWPSNVNNGIVISDWLAQIAIWEAQSLATLPTMAEYMEDETDNVKLGIGRLQKVLMQYLSHHTLTEMNSRLSYTINACEMQGTRPRTSGKDFSWEVVVGAEDGYLFRTPIQDVIDGMLMSEATLDYSEKITHCVCVSNGAFLNGSISLNPYWDSSAVLHGDDYVPETRSGGDVQHLRIHPLSALGGYYNSEIGLDDVNAYFYESAQFVQGITTMDSLLKAPGPSYHSVEIFDNVDHEWKEGKVHV